MSQEPDKERPEGAPPQNPDLTGTPPAGTVPSGKGDTANSAVEGTGAARETTASEAPPESPPPAETPAPAVPEDAGSEESSAPETTYDGSPESAYGYDAYGHAHDSEYAYHDPAADQSLAGGDSAPAGESGATGDGETEGAPAAQPADADPSAADDEEEGGGPVKPFLDHLEDLRWTLVKSISSVVVGMLICLVAGNYLIAFLLWPLKQSEHLFQRDDPRVALVVGTNVLARLPLEQFGGTNFWGTNRLGSFHLAPLKVESNTVLALQPVFGEPDVPPPSMVVIKNYGPIEGIMVALKLALYGGLVISSPFVFFFIGQFVLPALRVREKKILYTAVAYGSGLFFIGVAFCYLVVMVFAIGATVEFSKWLGFGADEWRADAYIGFVVKFMLGMGLAFELPVVILVLVKIGILDYERLKGFRQWAIVGNLVLSAFVTPSGDPVTMLIMAIPLQMLYEISVLVAWYWDRKERRQAAVEAANNR